MSRSAGPGSPSWFACPNERRERNTDYILGRSTVVMHGHRVVRTGKTKPYRSKRGSAIGLRSPFESHEYECPCGYAGWTNHRDILNRLIKEST